METYFYPSEFYGQSIEVVDISGEIIVIIRDKKDRESIFSWYDTTWKKTQSPYINGCLLWAFLKKIPESVLIVWFWWWSFARYLEDHILWDIKITWIEIDPVMIDISKEIMKVKTKDFYKMDAKIALEKIAKKKLKYESILIDIYDSSWAIPEYFLSQEFISQLKQVLTESWTISINFANANSSKKLFKKYKIFHQMMITNFSPYFNILSAWENDFWNLSVIYNLDKTYYKADFINNYLKNTKSDKIIYDDFIIKNIFLSDNYLD